MSSSNTNNQKQHIIHSLISYNLYGRFIKGWLVPSDSPVQICRKSFVCAQLADIIPSVAWLIYFAAFGNVVVLPEVSSSIQATAYYLRGSSSDFGASTAIIVFVSFIAAGLINVACYASLRFGTSSDSSSLATAHKLIEKRKRMAPGEGCANYSRNNKSNSRHSSSNGNRSPSGGGGGGINSNKTKNKNTTLLLTLDPKSSQQLYSRPRPKPVADVIFDLLLIVQGFLTFGYGWIIGLDFGVNLITSRVACIAAIASLGRARYAGSFFFIFFALIWCSVGRMGEQPATMPGAQSQWWPYFCAHTLFLMLLHIFIVRDVWHVMQSPAQKLSDQTDHIDTALSNLAQLPFLLQNADRVTSFDSSSRKAVRSAKECLLNSMKEFYKALSQIDDAALQTELLVLRNSLVLGHSMGTVPRPDASAGSMNYSFHDKFAQQNPLSLVHNNNNNNAASFQNSVGGLLASGVGSSSTSGHVGATGSGTKNSLSSTGFLSGPPGVGDGGHAISNNNNNLHRVNSSYALSSGSVFVHNKSNMNIHQFENGYNSSSGRRNSTFQQSNNNNGNGKYPFKNVGLYFPAANENNNTNNNDSSNSDIKKHSNSNNRQPSTLDVNAIAEAQQQENDKKDKNTNKSIEESEGGKIVLGQGIPHINDDDDDGEEEEGSKDESGKTSPHRHSPIHRSNTKLLTRQYSQGTALIGLVRGNANNDTDSVTTYPEGSSTTYPPPNGGGTQINKASIPFQRNNNIQYYTNNDSITTAPPNNRAGTTMLLGSVAPPPGAASVTNAFGFSTLNQPEQQPQSLYQQQPVGTMNNNKGSWVASDAAQHVSSDESKDGGSSSSSKKNAKAAIFSPTNLNHSSAAIEMAKSVSQQQQPNNNNNNNNNKNGSSSASPVSPPPPGAPSSPSKSAGVIINNNASFNAAPTNFVSPNLPDDGSFNAGRRKQQQQQQMNTVNMNANTSSSIIRPFQPNPVHHHHHHQSQSSHIAVSPQEQREKLLMASSARRDKRRSTLLILQAVNQKKAVSSTEGHEMELRLADIARECDGFVHVGSTAARTVISWNAVTDQPQANFEDLVARCVFAIKNKCRNFFVGAACTGVMLLPCVRGVTIVADSWLEQKLQSDLLKLAEHFPGNGGGGGIFLIDYATARGVSRFELDLADIFCRDFGGKSLLAMTDADELKQAKRFVPIFAIVRPLSEGEREDREINNRMIIEEEEIVEAHEKEEARMRSQQLHEQQQQKMQSVSLGCDDDDDFFHDPKRLMQKAGNAKGGVETNTDDDSQRRQQHNAAEFATRMHESTTVRAARYVHDHDWKNLAALLSAHSRISTNHHHRNNSSPNHHMGNDDSEINNDALVMNGGRIEAEGEVLGVLYGLAEWKTQGMNTMHQPQ